MYKHEVLPIQLKKIRLANKLSQTEACIRLNEIINTNFTTAAWGHWEKGTRTPDSKTLIGMAKLFNISIDFFFTDVDPDNNSIDLLISPSNAKRNIKNIENAFVNTYISKQVFNILKQQRMNIRLVKVCPRTGITRILNEFLLKNNDILIDKKSIDNLGNAIYSLIDKNISSQSLIFDDTLQISENIIKSIIIKFKGIKSIVIFTPTANYDDIADEIITINHMTLLDFNEILHALLPDISEETAAFIRILTYPNLYELDFLIKALKKKYNKHKITQKEIIEVFK